MPGSRAAPADRAQVAVLAPDLVATPAFRMVPRLAGTSGVDDSLLARDAGDRHHESP